MNKVILLSWFLCFCVAFGVVSSQGYQLVALISLDGVDAVGCWNSTMGCKTLSYVYNDIINNQVEYNVWIIEFTPGLYQGEDYCDLVIPDMLTAIKGEGATIDCLGRGRQLVTSNTTSFTLAVSNITFLNGYAQDDDGGCVLVLSESGMEFTQCTFQNCKSDGNGGAISSFLGGVSGTDLTISNCTAVGDGGAIYGGFNCQLHDSQLIGNIAGGRGGAVYSVQSFSRDCTFIENQASLGGAIYTLASNVEVEGCSFNKNSAHSGGAILFTCSKLPDESPNVRNSNFYNNYASNSGGAINFQCPWGFLKNVDFVGNVADSVGGALYITNGTSTIQSGFSFTNVTITGNTAYGIGAGIFAEVESLTNLWYENSTHVDIWDNINAVTSTSTIVDNVACNSLACAHSCPSSSCENCGAVCVTQTHDDTYMCLSSQYAECNNGGTCTIEATVAVCHCPADYSGSDCSVKAEPDDESIKGLWHKYMYYVIGAGALVFIVLVVIIGLIIRCRIRRNIGKHDYSRINANDNLFDEN